MTTALQTIKINKKITLELSRSAYEYLFRLIASADFNALDQDTGLMVRFIIERVYLRMVRKMCAPLPAKVKLSLKSAEAVALSHTLNTIDLVASGDAYGVNLVNMVCGTIDQKLA